jgi:hypothetical protein
MKTVRTIAHPDGERRVLIVDRGDGRFGYEEEYFSKDPQERYWLPRRQYPLTICDSPERAEREARANVDWLRDEPERQP